MRGPTPGRRGPPERRRTWLTGCPRTGTAWLPDRDSTRHPAATRRLTTRSRISPRCVTSGAPPLVPRSTREGVRVTPRTGVPHDASRGSPPGVEISAPPLDQLRLVQIDLLDPLGEPGPAKERGDVPTPVREPDDLPAYGHPPPAGRRRRVHDHRWVSGHASTVSRAPPARILEPTRAAGGRSRSENGVSSRRAAAATAARAPVEAAGTPYGRAATASTPAALSLRARNSISGSVPECSPVRTVCRTDLMFARSTPSSTLSTRMIAVPPADGST
ncbi:hypothetical protein SATRM34S_04974 [Streptomyces atroolivaceus]